MRLILITMLFNISCKQEKEERWHEICVKYHIETFVIRKIINGSVEHIPYNKRICDEYKRIIHNSKAN